MDKYGRHRPSESFPVTVSFSQAVQEFRRNFANSFPSTPRCVTPIMIRSVDQYGRQTAISEMAICSLLDIVTNLLLHLLRDHSSPSRLFVPARIWFRSFDKYGRCLSVFTLSHIPSNQRRNLIETLHMDSTTPSYVSSETIPIRRLIWLPEDYLGFPERRQMGLTPAIFDVTVITSPPLPVEESCRNLAHEFFSTNWWSPREWFQPIN